MIIKDNSTSVNLSSYTTYDHQDTVEQVYVIDKNQSQTSGTESAQTTISNPIDQVTLSSEALNQLLLDKETLADAQIGNALDQIPRFDESDLLRKDILNEMLTKVWAKGEVTGTDLTFEAKEDPIQLPSRDLEDSIVPEYDGEGHVVAIAESISRDVKKTLSFQADGLVKTEDGRSIDFSVDLSMTEVSQHVWGKTVILKDPLVINFDGAGPELTERNFRFDLDNDGTEDQISFLKQGSGFLAFDANENGVVDNGTELFGTQTGDGFLELSFYDKDGNQWIDENDDIFDKLQIWSIDGDGNKTLTAIGEKGIGAIYLGNVETDLSLRDSSGETNGVLRQSGIGLMEDGRAVTVNQIDLVVDDYLYESGVAGRLPEYNPRNDPNVITTARVHSEYQNQDGAGAQKQSVSVISNENDDTLSIRAETASVSIAAKESGMVKLENTIPADDPNLLHQGTISGQRNLQIKENRYNSSTSIDINGADKDTDDDNLMKIRQQTSETSMMTHIHKSYTGETSINNQLAVGNATYIENELQTQGQSIHTQWQINMPAAIDSLAYYQETKNVEQLIDTMDDIKKIADKASKDPDNDLEAKSESEKINHKMYKQTIYTQNVRNSIDYYG